MKPPFHLKTSAAAIAAALVLTISSCAVAQEASGATAPIAEAPVALPEAEVQKLLATYALIKQNYVGETDDKKLFDAALAGMLASLDPHSQYMNEEAMREMTRAATGRYAGIGVEIELDHDRMHVISAIDDSPAARAGIRAGDVIVAIDGVPLASLSTDEVARRMLGESGTAATFEVQSGIRLRKLRIERAVLQDRTVHTRIVSNGVAWIRISQFSGPTGGELAKALKQLDSGTNGKPVPRGLILDLRNDPGGLVAAGVAVAGAFLPEGTVLFSARGRESAVDTTVTVDQRYYRQGGEADVLADLPAWTRSVPMIILVNGATASSAELVAGALQDHGRATVVGTRTFGKGSIQSIIALDEESGIKFTVARYFTPKGREVQEHGVRPDLVVAPASATPAGDAPLLREADLAGHLAASEPDVAGSGRAALEHTRAFGTSDDKALRMAVKLLEPHKPSGMWTTLLRKLRGKPRQDVASTT